MVRKEKRVYVIFCPSLVFLGLRGPTFIADWATNILQLGYEIERENYSSRH